MTERRFDETRPSRLGTALALTGFWSEISWSAIIAGAFIACALIVLLLALGSAVGMTVRSNSSDPNGYYSGWGWGIWGLIVVILSYFLGGWVAARIAALRGYSGALNGLMVWAVATTLILLGVSSIVPSARGAVYTGGSVFHLSVQPGGDMGMPSPNTVPSANDDAARQQAKSMAAAAWWGFIGLVLALAAACVGGIAVGGDQTYAGTTSGTGTLPPGGSV